MSRPIPRTPASRAALPAVQSIAPYQPGKPIVELQRELGVQDIVKLASNENPLGPSPRALLALQRELENVALYPDGSGHALKQALAAHLGLTPEQLLLGNGSNDVLVLLAEAYLAPGRNAVYSQYGFAIYPIAVAATGAEGREAPALSRAHAMPLGHDLNALASRIDADTRIVFIANPNNPTGTWLPAGDLRAFIARVPEDCLVVLDEAYLEYARELGGSDGVAWLPECPHLVVVRTFSKAYGLAGLRIGYAAAHPDVIDVLERLRQPFNVSSLAMAAAAAALDDRLHLERSVAVTRAGRVQLRDGCERLGLAVLPSAGNFL
ncbi:MAG: histidinol-phosphate transaminase, partial [Steroidobacteraceae bacterium]|nr:histidinol-phosphate transaminase [Steroidobacteraceae bacterium]MDW8259781.1 histidinol-phosphate transaminase [Gammaproteobacteria bacterium]